MRAGRFRRTSSTLTYRHPPAAASSRKTTSPSSPIVLNAMARERKTEAHTVGTEAMTRDGLDCPANVRARERVGACRHLTRPARSRVGVAREGHERKADRGRGPPHRESHARGDRARYIMFVLQSEGGNKTGPRRCWARSSTLYRKLGRYEGRVNGRSRLIHPRRNALGAGPAYTKAAPCGPSWPGCMKFAEARDHHGQRRSPTTPEALDQLLAEGKVQRVVHHPHNRGKGSPSGAPSEAASGDVCVVQTPTSSTIPPSCRTSSYPSDGRAMPSSAALHRGGATACFFCIAWQRLADASLQHATDLNLTDMESCYKMVRTDVLKRWS